MIKGQLHSPDLILYILYINMFLDPIRRLVSFTEQFQKGMTGFERMVEILASNPEVQTNPDAVQVGKLKGDIHFENVSFSYEENEFVLKDISLEIPVGQALRWLVLQGREKRLSVH